MSQVLVTGASGLLGSQLLPRLRSEGHEVRALSRHPRPERVSDVDWVACDVLDRDGIASAVTGCDSVIHAATVSYGRRSRATEVDGTTNVAAAAKAAGARVVYISIVGVDQNRISYYGGKYSAEQALEASGGNWTILRATQFHPLLAEPMRYHFMPATPNLAFQPVDAGDVADRLVALATSNETGRVPDFGGPEILTVRELIDAWSEITGRRVVRVPVPTLGFLADFDSGAHLAPEHRAGTLTWRDWLRRRPLSYS
jgi:uncharacterized protein YbjT (DUF2867 family)